MSDFLVTREEVLGGLPAERARSLPGCLRYPEHAWSRAISSIVDRITS